MVDDGWRQLTLDNVVTLQRGYDLPHRNRKPGNVPVVASAGIIGTHNEPRATGPGVVTGRYGTIGDVFFVREDYWPLNTSLFVSDFQGNDPLFISYLLRTIDYQSYSGKSGVPGVNRNDLYEIIVNLPPVTEQRSIAIALHDTDSLMASLDQLIAKKRGVKQAAMQQLLTGKTRLQGFGGRPAPNFKQSEVGMIPEDWQVTELKHLANVNTGARNTQDRVDDGAYPFFVRSQIVERINGYSFDGEAVLTAGDGVGTGKVFHYINGQFDYHQRVYKISDFGNGLDGYFFYLYFSNNFYKRIMAMTAKSSVDSVRMEMITDMLIPLPSLPEQRAIASTLSDMDTEINALEVRRDKTQAVKQGMMQDLLTGKRGLA